MTKHYMYQISSSDVEVSIWGEMPQINLNVEEERIMLMNSITLFLLSMNIFWFLRNRRQTPFDSFFNRPATQGRGGLRPYTADGVFNAVANQKPWWKGWVHLLFYKTQFIVC